MSSVAHIKLPIRELKIRRKVALVLAQGLDDIALYLYWFGSQFSSDALYKYYMYLLAGSDPFGKVFSVSDLNSIAVVTKHEKLSIIMIMSVCYLIALLHPSRWRYVVRILKSIYELNRCRPRSGYYYLDAIATKPEYRKQGLASALLIDICASIEDRGGGVLVCDTSTNALISILERHKWQKIAVTSFGDFIRVSTYMIEIKPSV